MRDIKFRMWNGKKMFHGVLAGFHSVEYLLPGVGEWKRISRAECDVMQFTGSVDKTGKEIFEGDIVDLGKGFTPRFRPIVYTEYGSWSIGHIGIGFGSMKANGFVYCEIIGNIHENPELIKG